MRHSDSTVTSNPYQIYSEISNAGKNIQGTKKRVKWRFGWSNSGDVHEVDFIHSVVSGKKVIKENGKEVTTATNLMSSEFGYGWNSFSAPHHIYRIEANFGLADSSYIFSIDGVPFMELPREPVRASDGSNNRSTFAANSFNSAIYGGQGQGSLTSRGRSNSNSRSDPRSDFQSRHVDGDFDNAFDNSDPFASESKSAAQAGNKSDVFSNSDPFGDDNATIKRLSLSPSVSNKVSPRATRPASARTPTMSNSPGIALNPNGGLATKSKPLAATNSNNSFDLLDDLPVARAPPSKSSSILDDLLTLQTGPAYNSNDIFAQVDDPFAPKPFILPTNSKSSSTFGTTGVITVDNNTNTANKTDSSELLSPLTRSLVDLEDIRKAPSRDSVGAKSREEEYKKNLSLNTLMVGSGTQKTVMLGPSETTPAPQPPPMRQVSPSEAIAMMGPTPPRGPIMMGGPGPVGALGPYSGPLGGPGAIMPQQQFGMMQPLQQPSMGPGMMGGPRPLMMAHQSQQQMPAYSNQSLGYINTSATPSTTYNKPPTVATNSKQQNSLDSLDWRM